MITDAATLDRANEISIQLDTLKILHASAQQALDTPLLSPLATLKIGFELVFKSVQQKNAAAAIIRQITEQQFEILTAELNAL